MPGGFPIGLDLSNCISGADTTASNGILVNPSATANTKGSYVTLIAATSIDACWMDVGIQNLSGNITGVNYAFDIAVGAAGSERIIANNLMTQAGTDTRRCPRYSFPCSIPAGSRVSARSQFGAASETNSGYVSVQLYDGAFSQMEGSAGVDIIGFTAGSTTGVSVTSGAANVKGTFTQLIAATARDYIGLLLTTLVTTAPTGSSNYLVDIAVGAGNSIIIPNLLFDYSGGANANGPEVLGPFFIGVPAGSRISARTQCSIASSLCGLVLYGIYL